WNRTVTREAQRTKPTLTPPKTKPLQPTMTNSRTNLQSMQDEPIHHPRGLRLDRTGRHDEQ
ncbi:hypothetical protein ABTE50_19095, partial [Acinetobacter baumannii]